MPDAVDAEAPAARSPRAPEAASTAPTAALSCEGQAPRAALSSEGQAPRAPRLKARRTPCVGICSTTYGDLVCRGCKRFAHEIVGWNGYLESQRDLVWSRLRRLLGESVRAHLRIVDEERLRTAALAAQVPDAARLPADVLAFETLRLSPLPLDALGLARVEPGPADVRDAVLAIDREFYLRSRAHFEASFKTLSCP